MAASRRVTLNDVAAASGVSRATAGFVLANDPNQSISAATSERVHAAAARLGYVPNGVARALREGSSRVVVLEIDAQYDGNYSRGFIRGLDAELTANGHALFVRHGPYTDRATDQVLHAIAPRAILRFGESYQAGKDLEDFGGGWRDGLAAHAALQIGYLVEHGHEQIALALPDTRSALTEARVRLTAQSAQTLGVPQPACFDVPRPRAETVAAVEAFRAEHPDVTAIAAFSDVIALRVMSALRGLGLSVPADVAVIGFDDDEAGALATPSLTTLHRDADVHGRRAARNVLGLDAGDLAPAPARSVARESA